jgi:hypothetical protein
MKGANRSTRTSQRIRRDRRTWWSLPGEREAGVASGMAAATVASIAMLRRPAEPREADERREDGD